MDDLLALIEGAEKNDADDKYESLNPNKRNNGAMMNNMTNVGNNNYNNNNNNNNNNNSNSKNASSSNTVDPYTGLRIVNRRISRLEMVDALVHYEFHTAVQLAAMSQHALSTNVVTVPATNGGGKTNAATMGLVFSNSGTRLSKNKGSAFSILTVGDLTTGPTLTVFLFGSAYSKYTTTAKPGLVISILCPNLLPPNNNNNKSSSYDTTILSFSVQDEKQIGIVGTAQDYALCSGVVNNTNNYNNYNAPKQNHPPSTCRQYVDLRLGRFCRKHQHQQNLA